MYLFWIELIHLITDLIIIYLISKYIKVNPVPFILINLFAGPEVSLLSMGVIKVYSLNK